MLNLIRKNNICSWLLVISASVFLAGCFGKKEVKLPEKMPNTYVVEFETTKGSFKVKLDKSWSPRGVERFYELLKAGFFKDLAAFRVLPGFVAQFGIHGDPAVSKVWRQKSFPDDPKNQSNAKGTLVYATAGPHSRTSQFFFNYSNNRQLDNMGFTPIGMIQGDGLKVVEKFYSGYGEGAPRGKGPDQGSIQSKGNDYLKKGFPKLDYIKSVKFVE